MKNRYLYGIVIILTIILIIAISLFIHYYNKCDNLKKEIENKDNKIDELSTENYNIRMAQDETYELFLDCVYNNN